jgi:hypothetical protein
MLDIRIANQENEVPTARPVAALSASRMKAAVKGLSPFLPQFRVDLSLARQMRIPQ